MAEKTRNSEDARRGREMLALLDGHQALQILSALVKKSASTAAAAARAADELFARIIPDEIGESLFQNLDNLEVEDCWDASGKQRGGGYLDPIDVAYDMMGDVVEDFISDMTKMHDMGKYDEELHTLEGILLGLQRFDEEATTQIIDYLQDDSESFAYDAIGEWFKRNPDAVERHAELRKFIDEQIPEWSSNYEYHKERNTGRISRI
jgi:choline dehydrogenase-like flavoprotein